MSMKKEFRNWIKQIPENKLLGIVTGSTIFASIYTMNTSLFQYSQGDAFMESSFFAILGGSFAYGIFQLVDKEKEKERDNQNKNGIDYMKELEEEKEFLYMYMRERNIPLHLQRYMDLVSYIESNCFVAKEEMIHWKITVPKNIMELLILFKKLDSENREYMRNKIVHMLAEQEKTLQDTYIKPYQENVVASCERKLEEITKQKHERIYLSE